MDIKLTLKIMRGKIRAHRNFIRDGADPLKAFYRVSADIDAFLPRIREYYRIKEAEEMGLIDTLA